MLSVAVLASLILIVGVAKVVLPVKIDTWIGNSRHGRTREDFMLKTRHEDVESFALFTSTGRKILETSSGHFNHVKIERYACVYCRFFRHVVSIHNHPVNSCFSAGDLMVFRRLNVAEGVICCPGYNYYVCPRDGWGEKQDIFVAMKNHLDKVFVINPEAELDKQECLMTHEAFERIAEELNYEYRREEVLD